MNQQQDVFNINQACMMLRKARAAALQAFEDQFPELYRLSADAFERPLGSIPHRMRLGEFLTEWDNELGKSPLECLAQGSIEPVREALAKRAGLDLAGQGGA